MIAVPVKTNKEDTVVSTSFGKAKYFALINGNKIDILRNEFMRGKRVINWLKNEYKVDTIITSHLGQAPFSMICQSNIKVYFAGEQRISLKDVLISYNESKLPLLTNENFSDLIVEHEHFSSSSCCGHNHKKVKNRLSVSSINSVKSFKI